MAVSSVSPATQAPVAQPAQKPNAASQERQLRKELEEVSKALENGDRTAAKEAAAVVQRHVDQAPPAQEAKPEQNILRNAVKGLGEALKTGSLSDAKKAFAVVHQAQQQKIDQRNTEHTRQSVANVITPPTADAAVGRNVDTRA